QALAQHGRSLARELRVQTVWNEAFERTHAHDTNWMRAFYGSYLSTLFGYDNIYVLTSDAVPIYAFANERHVDPSSFTPIAGELNDLVAAVRAPASAPAGYPLLSTPLANGGGAPAEHRAIADVRNIEGVPATV